jgi:2-octaprenyl-6-methoxyphenol hydroxylase
LKGARGAYPLVSQIAKSMVAARVALLGDAAHAIHPLAGLGLNLGYKDAAALADCVAQACSRGDDLGGAAMLAQYAQARRFDTWATATAMEAMNSLFVNDNAALKLARTAGLRLIDRLPRAKDFLMQQAGGTAQDNPRLLRGLLPG